MRYRQTLQDKTSTRGLVSPEVFGARDTCTERRYRRKVCKVVRMSGCGENDHDEETHIRTTWRRGEGGLDNRIAKNTYLMSSFTRHGTVGGGGRKGRKAGQEGELGGSPPIYRTSAPLGTETVMTLALLGLAGCFAALSLLLFHILVALLLFVVSLPPSSSPCTLPRGGREIVLLRSSSIASLLHVVHAASSSFLLSHRRRT